MEDMNNDNIKHVDEIALLRFFRSEHLAEHYREIVRPFEELAHQMVGTLPMHQERIAFLRKLLEAKDCAVRAAVAGRD
jgi:hypothetical protein